ncbi:hypothetical protein [Allosphingosinicella sp.]|jgi:hypothetical protein|uniref:hypothetical protein n=1 Tax=Allosphingosinicella sp. TaxID=2823234 RepID=UPI002F02996C
MSEVGYSKAAILLAFASLAACTPSAVTEQAPPVRARAGAPPTRAVAGLGTVIGRNAAALTTQFGRPALDIREGTARKLQFESPVCILDTYLYPPAAGGEPIVTHVDARLPDGRDMDRASCVAALSAQRQVR